MSHHVTAIWPPAGIALAGLFLLGFRVLPLIFISAFILSAAHLEHATLYLSIDDVLQSGFISLGITAEAALGYYIVNRINPRAIELLDLKATLQLMLIGGPISCIVGAAIGTSSLLYFQSINASQIFNSFIHWWAGDAIGVMIFTPLMLVAFSVTQVRRRVQVLLPGLLVFLLISTLFYAQIESDKLKNQQVIETKSQMLQFSVAQQLQKIQSSIGLLEAYYESSEYINYLEFIKFSDKQLKFSDEFSAIEWLPKVLASDRLKVETELQQIGFQDFSFKERDSLGRLVTASQREVYFPVLFVNPLKGNENALGFDFASHPARISALNLAARTKKPVLTEPLSLLQQQDSSLGVLYIVPVMENQPSGGLKGYALGVLHLRKIIDAILGPLELDGFKIAVLDVTNNVVPKVLYQESHVADLDPVFHFKTSIGQREWRVNLYQITDALSQASWMSQYGMQVFGLLFVWLLITFLLLLTGTNFQISEQVHKQTQKLLLEKQKSDKANKVKSEFLANMSHEIRTPINGIKGLHYLVLQQNDLHKIKEYIHQAENAVDVLLKVLNDLLDFSKIEAGKLQLEYSEVYFTALFSQLETLVKTDLTNKGIGLVIQYPKITPLSMFADKIRLKQVLLNLLNNAIKFTNFGGKVELTMTVLNNKFVRFSVKDNGIGVSAEAQKTLFDAFTQADNSTSRQYGGTGLGLGICKHLVELMGGEIGFVSEVNVGSEFYFTLPLGQFNSDEAPRKAAHFNIDDVSLSQFKILVAEDNPLNQQVISAILTGKGCTPDIAENGQVALNKLEQNEYDLVLMDIQMPLLDGLATTKQIRLNPKFKNLPIIGLSANAMDSDIANARAAGMNDYVVKPLDPNKLFKAILKYV